MSIINIYASFCFIFIVTNDDYSLKEFFDHSNIIGPYCLDVKYNESNYDDISNITLRTESKILHIDCIGYEGRDVIVIGTIQKLDVNNKTVITFQTMIENQKDMGDEIYVGPNEWIILDRDLYFTTHSPKSLINLCGKPHILDGKIILSVQ